MEKHLVSLSLILILQVLLVTIVGTFGEVVNSSKTSVYIIITTESPKGEKPEAFDLKILAVVLGSEKAAKDALIYSYPTSNSFAARLTLDQASVLKKAQGVLAVIPSKGHHVGKTINSSKTSVYIVTTESPKGEKPQAFDLKILAYVLGSEKAAKEALIYFYPALNSFAARLTLDQASQLKKAQGVVAVIPSKGHDLDRAFAPNKSPRVVY